MVHPASKSAVEIPLRFIGQDIARTVASRTLLQVGLPLDGLRKLPYEFLQFEQPLANLNVGRKILPTSSQALNRRQIIEFCFTRRIHRRHSVDRPETATRDHYERCYRINFSIIV